MKQVASPVHFLNLDDSLEGVCLSQVGNKAKISNAMDHWTEVADDAVTWFDNTEKDSKVKLSLLQNNYKIIQ